MTQFLSDEYMEEATSTLRANEGFMNAIRGVDLDIQFVVTDSPEGDFEYRMLVRNDDVKLSRETSDKPDATVTNSYETAAGISKGELNTQMAFITGKLKVAGNMAALMRNQSVINHFATALSNFETEY